MIEEYMRLPASSGAILGVLFITAALIGTPLAIFALQQQQDIRQRADTTLAWATDQSAASSCPTGGSGAQISVTFSNTEPDRTYYGMDVTAVDRQTNKSVSLGSIKGGQTKTAIIQTCKTTITSGTVDFNLTWTDGHRGTYSRSASYKAVSYCIPAPTPTPTKPVSYATPTPPKYPSSTPPYATPTKPYSTPKPYPSYGPSPTICPTLGPVKNVRIDCPNCAKY